MALSTARARRLARLADGTAGWFGRRAWRILAIAAEQGDANAVGFLWQAWLRSPADETWAVVNRWRTPADVFAAATDPARNASARAALGAFCERHELVPENAVECAVFFVLTGRHERYQALDPDGTLLAAGYRGADEPTREALRHTMIGLGELDLVRVVADRPDRPLTGEEAEYLAGRLAAAGEWRRLWRLVPAIPLAGAVRAARLFGDWRPPDDHGRALFERLVATHPDAVARLGRVTLTSLGIAETSGLSFAPDGSELAVTRFSGTTVVAVPGRYPVATHDGHGQRDVLAFGGGTIVHRSPFDEWAIVRRAPGRPREVLLPAKPRATVGRTPDGFVVVSRGDGIWFGVPAGPWSRVVRAHELPVGLPDSANLVATDPASGRLAMSAPGALLVVDANLTVTACGEPGGHEVVWGAFLAPGHLVTRGRGDHSIVSWRVDGTSLERVAANRLAGGEFLAPVPGHADRMVLLRPRGLVWLDADTLTDTSPPPGFPRLAGSFLSFSLDGSLVAVGKTDRMEVHDMAEDRLAALAGRSIVELGRADRDVVEALARRLRTTEVLDLVRAGLEYRFGADIALDAGTRVAARDDDIALGGSA